MRNNRETTLSKFERTLKSSIAKKFGGKISAQRFADQYNLHAYGTGTISRETARKWITGSAIPDYERLVVLIQWLDLDPLDFLHPDKEKVRQYKANAAKFLMSVGQNHTDDLIAIARSLDERSAEALFITAWALKHAKRPLG